MKKLLRNKKGIEVTINFIVMIILGIAVLSGSLILINRFFGSAEELKTSIDSQTESQIKSMLVGGAKVAIPVNRITAHRGDFSTFGVGILNVLTKGTVQDEFDIIALPCTAKISNINHEIEAHNPEQTALVKKNDQKIFLVGYNIERDKPRGTYICDIYVCTDGFDSQNNRCHTPYAETVYKAYIIID